MIWIALAIVLVGYLIYQEIERHNKKIEELNQKKANDSSRLKQEELSANPKYTKLKSLQSEISRNRKVYAIDIKDKKEVEESLKEAVVQQNKEKINSLKKDLLDYDKQLKDLQKEYLILTKQLVGTYGEEGFRGVIWPED